MAPEDGEDTTESQRSASFLSGKDLPFSPTFFVSPAVLRPSSENEINRASSIALSEGVA